MMENEVREPVIESLHQSCLGCCFAEVEGKTQKGCKLGRLKTFSKQGRVVSVYDAGGNEFEIINGRKCNAYRPQSWADNYVLDDWETQVRKEIETQVTVLVLMKPGTETYGLLHTITALVEQTLPPKEVVFVNSQDGLKIGQLHAFIAKQLGGKLNWRLTDILPDENGHRRSGGAAIDEAFSKISGQFYVVVESGSELPQNFIAKLDETLNDKLDQIVAVAPYENKGFTGLTVQTAFHKHPSVRGHAYGEAEGFDLVGEQIAPGIDGNGEPTPPRFDKVRLVSIVDKAKFLSQLSGDGAPRMVLRAEELCLLR